MNHEIGSSVFVFEGIKNDLFSPTKYSIASLSPDHIEFETVNDQKFTFTSLVYLQVQEAGFRSITNNLLYLKLYKWLNEALMN